MIFTLAAGDPEQIAVDVVQISLLALRWPDALSILIASELRVQRRQLASFCLEQITVLAIVECFLEVYHLSEVELKEVISKSLYVLRIIHTEVMHNFSVSCERKSEQHRVSC